jgi:hypothetical protein
MPVTPDTKNIIHNILKRRVEAYAKELIEEAKNKLDDKLPEIIAEMCIEINEREELSSIARNINFNINRK